MSSISSDPLSPIFEVTTATPGNSPNGDAGFSDLLGEVLAGSNSSSRPPETSLGQEVDENSNASEQEDSQQQEATSEQTSSTAASSDEPVPEGPGENESNEDAVEISEEAIAVESETQAIEVTEETNLNSETEAVAQAAEQEAAEVKPSDLLATDEAAQETSEELEQLGGSVEATQAPDDSHVEQQTTISATIQAEKVATRDNVVPTAEVNGADRVVANEEAKAQEKNTVSSEVTPVAEETGESEQEQAEPTQPEALKRSRKSASEKPSTSAAEQPVGDKAVGITSVDPEFTTESAQPTTSTTLQVSTPSSAELLTSVTARAGTSPLTNETTTADVERGDTPTVDRNRFLGRVSGAFKAAQQRDGRIQVRLSPPELGLLRIELSVQQGSLTASLETETNAARNLILENLPALRDRLAEQDIRIETFDVDVRDEGRQAPEHELPGERRADQRPKIQRQAKSTEGANANDQVQEESKETIPAGDDKGLDIRV